MLVLHPKFRLFCPAVKQGIYAAHMLWVNIAQKTDMSRKSRPICQTVCILQPREFQEEVLQCIKQFGENTITYFSLNKITEIVPSFHVTHSYMQFRPSRDENAGPFDLKWILKSLSKWKFALRCFSVNTFEVKLCEEEQLERIILTLTFVVGFFV